MVAGIVLANPIAAVVQHLRADADVAAICAIGQPAGRSPRIAASFPESVDPTRQWHMPNTAVLVSPGGGPADNIYTGERWARVDIRCFGYGRTHQARRLSADKLWRTVDPALCPPPGRGLSSSFHAAGCEVQSITAESGPTEDVEDGTDWWMVTVPYLVHYMSQQVSP